MLVLSVKLLLKTSYFGYIGGTDHAVCSIQDDSKDEIRDRPFDKHCSAAATLTF